MTAVLYKQDVM